MDVCRSTNEPTENCVNKLAKIPCITKCDTMLQIPHSVWSFPCVCVLCKILGKQFGNDGILNREEKMFISLCTTFFLNFFFKAIASVAVVVGFCYRLTVAVFQMQILIMMRFGKAYISMQLKCFASKQV